MRRRARCEALMAVPPGPAQPGPHRFSAGMQVCRVCRRVGAPPDVGLRPVFPLGCGCVGAPPDVGLGLFSARLLKRC